MKKLLKNHFDQFEEGQDEISQQLLEKIYSLENEGGEIIKRSVNYKKIYICLASCVIMIALAIPMGIRLFNNDTVQVKNPNKNKYVTPVGNGLLALSRNGNYNIAKALIMAVDDYKENNNKVSGKTNHIKYLSKRNLPMNNTTQESNLNQDIEPRVRYEFNFVDFYDTFEFYVDVEVENEFTAKFEDTHFRVLISNVDLYGDSMTVWTSEQIIVLINGAGQMISCLTNSASYSQNEVSLDFSNHKWLDGNDVVKDFNVSPAYVLNLKTNYKDRFDLTYIEFRTNSNQTDRFAFKTVKNSYYKVDDHIMFDLNNLVDRVATVTFLELIDENKFAFEYQDNVYYCLFDETILDSETIKLLSNVKTLTIVFDGFFVGDSLDTIEAQKITFETFIPKETLE